MRLNLVLGRGVPVGLARELDVKIDDGVPDTGALRLTVSSGATFGEAAEGEVACVRTGGSGDRIYDVGSGSEDCNVTYLCRPGRSSRGPGRDGRWYGIGPWTGDPDMTPEKLEHARRIDEQMGDIVFYKILVKPDLEKFDDDDDLDYLEVRAIYEGEWEKIGPKRTVRLPSALRWRLYDEAFTEFPVLYMTARTARSDWDQHPESE